jgi:glycosyltransferase involved in cell wall biosynthesis
LKAPLVSVIITAFKRTQYLEAALRSVFAQTVSHLEVIVTDDANCQRTGMLCNAFAEDSRLRYRANSTRRGALLNIGEALLEARGEFVAILNDDDQMEPQMVEALLPPLVSNSDCVLACGDRWMVDGSGKVLMELSAAASGARGLQRMNEGFVGDPFGFALRGGVLIAMGVLFRRTAFRPEWLTSRAGGAYDLWLGVQLALTGGLVHYQPQRVMRYRVHDNSESARSDPEKSQGEIFIYESLLKNPLSASDRAYVQDRLAKHWFVCGRERLHFNNPREARKALACSLRVRIALKPLLLLVLSFFPGTIRISGISAWRSARRLLCAAKSSRRSDAAALTPDATT